MPIKIKHKGGVEENLQSYQHPHKKHYVIDLEAKEFKGKEVKAVSETKKPGGVIETEEEVLGVSKLVGPTASVSFKMGVTKKMVTDYESVRVDVMLTMPCEPTLPAVDEAYEFVQAWTDDKLGILVAKLEASGIIAK